MIAPGTLDPDEQWAMQLFPGLAGQARKTSNHTQTYNCLAWALGLTRPWYSPLPVPGYYWPQGVPREWSVTTARQVLALGGYTEETTNRDFESGCEKVAIYAFSDGRLQHFARQLPNGKWTSKLGGGIDIEHDTLEGLHGAEYGAATVILKKKN